LAVVMTEVPGADSWC